MSIENRRFLHEPGQFGPKFQVQGSLSPTVLFVGKLVDRSSIYRIKMWAEVSFVLSQCTRLTDRQTDFDSARMHSQSRGKNVSVYALRGWSVFD